MYMLGYDIEIGHMEALRLITSSKFSEKNAGYMACAILWNEHSEFLRLLVQSVRKDLSPSNEIIQCLALAFIANIGGNEFAEGLAQDVQKLLVSGKSRSFVRKKSALCLLRLYRKNPECIPLYDNNFPAQLLALLDDPNIGVCTSVMSLLLGIASHHTRGFEGSVEKATMLLSKLVFSKEKRSIYRYYLTLCPWLQVKCLRLLQYFPPPAGSSSGSSSSSVDGSGSGPVGAQNLLARLTHVLNEILTKTSLTKNVNKNNADHSILFEAIYLIIHYCTCGWTDMQGAAIGLLGRFISIREANFRYLGLDAMAKLAHVPGSLNAIKKHQEVVQAALHDPDVSIRKRGLDLLYVMCDKSNARPIVDALLSYLSSAPLEIREELVLKIAILSEKYAPDLRWYVDVILQLITLSGEFVSDDIWFRVVQIVTNAEELQEYAATKALEFLNNNKHAHETGLRVASYMLGEFGEQIQAESVSGSQLFQAIHQHFKSSSPTTKAIMLSSYAKMANTYPELKDEIGSVLDAHRSSVECEVQQRACEYFALNQSQYASLMESVLDVMPNYSERESLLLKRLNKNKKAVTDRDVWGEKDEGEKKKKEKGKGEEKKESGESSDEEDESESESDEESSSEDESESESESEDESSSDSEEEGSTRQVKPKPGATVDLLGGLASVQASAPSAAMSTASLTDSVSFPPQSSSFVLNLLGKASGVLYESRELQIGLKLNIESGHAAKLVFYYGNRCPNALKGVSASLPESDAYRMQVRPTEPFEVAPKKQVMHFFLVHCFKPFKGPININIKFNYLNKPQILDLSLPLFISSFTAPTSLDGAAFVHAWGKYGNEQQATRKSVDGSVVTVDAVKAALQEKAKLFIVQGVEKNNDNVVAAGTFHTATKNAAGAFVTMPCLVRVETKPNLPMFRLTVHSGHSTVSDALMHTITYLLNAKE